MSKIVGIEALPGERWLEAVGFPGYMVSSHGRIVSVRRKTPVLMCPECDKDGYFRLQLRRGGKHTHVVLSRLVCETFNGPPSSKEMVCCHKDGNASNNFHDNLRWDTQKGNIGDKLLHGTHQIGEKHPGAEITSEMARRVKDELRAYPGTRGKLLHVVRVTGAPYWVVADISKGRTWRHA